ncbi:MAG: hypothetical protein Q4B60_08800 [Erysipelotrichaceae bacterium]|nr:hypothetical protein [Erysipelotrichaceae bacterium]
MEYQNIATLIGLCGAISNNGKTENTDRVIKEGILGSIGVEDIYREKYKISPGCATCKHKCGNTDDGDLDKICNNPIKLKLINELVRYLENNETNDLVYRCLTYLNYDLKDESYLDLIEELKK